MGTDPFVISNPAGNNRVLLVTAMGQSGKTVRLARLRPGESHRCEKEEVTVRARKKPPTLDTVLVEGVLHCVIPQ